MSSDLLTRRLHAEWALVAILSCLLVAFAARGAWLGALDNRLYDLASGLAAPVADDRVLIAEIDQPSLQTIGRWPWSRQVHARALTILTGYRPAGIAYDVLFFEPSPDDAALGAAVALARPVFLPSVIEGDGIGPTRLAVPAPGIADPAVPQGVAQLLPDGDGAIRGAETTLVVEGKQVAQLPALLARAAKASAKHSEPASRFRIAYSGKDAFRRVSFASLVQGEVPPALVRGKLVLVGATAPGLGDMHPVPMAAGSLLSGVEIQANILNTLLGGTAIAAPGGWRLAAIALVPLMVLLIGFLCLTPGRNLMLATVLLVAVPLISIALLPLARIWLAPCATMAGILLVHALWGWRRLAVANRFLMAEADALLREPGVIAHVPAAGLGSDAIAAEAARLHAAIAQVRSLRGFIAQVIEQFPGAVLVIDAEDRVVLANGAATQQVGEGLLGAPSRAVMGLMLESAPVIGMPVRDRAGRSLLMSEAVIEGGLRIVSFADISELQRAADEREELLQFLSHDLRSPNAAIVWLLESQDLEAANPESAALLARLPAPLIEQIRGYARHGLRLADSFVQLVRARRRPLSEEPVDLCDVAREAADMVAAYARSREARLTNASDPGELWVMGDQGMLVRAVINLLENAIKFGPEGAAIEYRVRLQEQDVVFGVAGPGPAMPAGRAADPFALYAEGRTADGKGSVGLGLAFVQTTALRHHGRATYSYRDDFGATFEIVLPHAPLED
ncbi:MAG: CHASE2 domain-containing protein [Novosphingobium sp.]